MVYKIFLIIMYVVMLCMNFFILNFVDDMLDFELFFCLYKIKIEVLYIMIWYMFSFYVYDLY